MCKQCPFYKGRLKNIDMLALRMSFFFQEDNILYESITLETFPGKITNSLITFVDDHL